MGSSDGAKRPYYLLVFDFVVALALTLVPEHEYSTLKARPMGVISEQSRSLIGVAIAQWRMAACRGDERWNEAFATLAEVFGRERYIDVRLYMFQLSSDAVALFCAYEQEHFSE